MKLHKLALTLCVAALLPTFAHAGTDAVAGSFDRAFYNESFINSLSQKSDQVLASFERDTYHEPVVETDYAKADSNDDLLDAINVVLRGGAGKTIAQISVAEGDRLGG